jgi:hypothetical protein
MKLPSYFRNYQILNSQSLKTSKLSPTPSTFHNPHKTSIKLRLLVQQLFVLMSKFVNILEAAHDHAHKVGKDQRKHQVQQSGQNDCKSDEGAMFKFLFFVVFQMSVVQIDKECGDAVEENEARDEEVGKCGTDLKFLG